MTTVLFALLLLGSSTSSPQKTPKGPAKDPTSTHLLNIAQQLQSPGADATALLTEACKVIGFSVWTDPAQCFKPPTTTSPLHLAFDATEFRDYALMLHRGQSVKLADLEATYTLSAQKLNVKADVTGSVNQFLASIPTSTDDHLRNLGTFLEDLNLFHSWGSSYTIAPDGQLDPIQALFLMRIVSEDISTPFRRKLAVVKRPLLLASTHPDPGNSSSIPGWAEDGYAGLASGLFGQAVAAANDAGIEGAEELGNTVDRLNAGLTVAKMISMYLRLEGTIDFKPSMPLVRTKDSEPGAKGTLEATFKIVSDATSDQMKSMRTYLVGLGVDTDAATGGPLKNVETGWTFSQSNKFASLQVIQTDQDISKVMTDDNGVAKVNIEGKPQPNPIDVGAAWPTKKFVTITATPQAKKGNGTQDTIDSVSALSGMSGISGFVSAAAELLSRMKWICSASMVLEVKDWIPGDMIANATVDVSVHDHYGSKEETRTIDIDRQLVLSNILMKAGQLFNVPEIPEDVLEKIPPAQRTLVLEKLAQARDRAKGANGGGPAYVSRSTGHLNAKVSDYYFDSSRQEICFEKMFDNSTERYNGTADVDIAKVTGAGFAIQLDETRKVAIVSFSSQIKCDHISTHVTQYRNSTPTKDTQNVDILQGLSPVDAKLKKQIEVPYKTTTVPGKAGTDIYGTLTFPVTYREGSGTVEISFSLTRKSN